MTHIAVKSLLVCVIYGVMSILQTLNSRYLYRDLNFNFYSFVICLLMQTFGIQRVIIILFFFSQGRKHLSKTMLIKILPYSFFMCLSNILSSYCLTVMPLAAFLSFKKFIVLFIMAITVALKLPVQTNNFQNICIIGIVVGGAMVGQKDMLQGGLAGYFASLMFDLSQALVLQYSAYLYRHDDLQPSQLLLYNCMIGFPYYLGVITYEGEFDDIYYYFRDHFSLAFLFVILFSIVLACISQLSASYIAMKISPFQKSTVSNIKDLILMLISVFYYNDLGLNIVSGLGIVICLISSMLFSLPYLEEKKKQQIRAISKSIHSQHHHHHEEKTSLLNDKLTLTNKTSDAPILQSPQSMKIEVNDQKIEQSIIK